MAEKKDNKKERADKYEEKVSFDGTFEQIVQMSFNKPILKTADIHSSRMENPSLRIDTIGKPMPDDKFSDRGMYQIAFSMIKGGKKYWEYYSQEERDKEFERVKQEINAAK